MSITHVQINDIPSETSAVTPGPRQVVDDIIALWKEDPTTESLGAPKLHARVKQRHPNWLVSEKRVRQLLKEFGLNVNSSLNQITYAKDIVAHPTPADVAIPDILQVTMTSKRGKGLYAKKPIKEGTILWEEDPLFFVPPLQHTQLMRQGNCCAHCGKILQEKDAITKMLDCDNCPMVWCLIDCKKANKLHLTMFHLSGRLINAEKYMELEDYCLQESWNALYAIAHIMTSIVMEKRPEKGKLSLRELFDSLALVLQQVRYRALNLGGGSFDLMLGGALFVEEQQELLWKEGYEKFISVFPRLPLFSYNDFLTMLGTYNINNVDSNVFAIQLHMNHCCDPNVLVKSHPTDRTKPLQAVAARDISGGEELTTTYVNPSHTVFQRQRELRVNWGFLCACKRCKKEREEDQRRQSQLKPAQTKEDVREMLKGQNEEFDLAVPDVSVSGERRKLVRFDEKVEQMTVQVENKPGDTKPEDIYKK